MDMVFKIKGFGYRRGHNDIRDFTPDSKPIMDLEMNAKISLDMGLGPEDGKTEKGEEGIRNNPRLV